MVVLLPYPNNKTYTEMDNTEDIFNYRNEIIKYVKVVCTGPWSSDNTDVLQRGVRVRIGKDRDLFMLKIKYGLDIVQNV